MKCVPVRIQLQNTHSLTRSSFRRPLLVTTLARGPGEVQGQLRPLLVCQTVPHDQHSDSASRIQPHPFVSCTNAFSTRQ